MRLLCVLILFVVVSNATSTCLTEFYGRWTMVESFKDVNAAVDMANFRCSTRKFGPSRITRWCNGVQVPYFKLEDTPVVMHLAIPIADTHEEALDYMNRSHICSGVYVDGVFRKLDNNYIVLYTNHTETNPVLIESLFAKILPSWADLDANIHSMNEFKNRNRVQGTLCTNDYSN